MASANAKLVSQALKKARAALSASYDPKNGPVLSLGARQQRSRIDKGPSPNLWTCQFTYQAPKDDTLTKAVMAAVDALGKIPEGVERPVLADVTVEWVGIRHDLTQNVPCSPTETLEALNKDARSSTTVLFIHGGAFFQNGFGNSRSTAAKLAKSTGGRVILLDYRLAPQSAFPTQLLDILVCYLQLLNPSPDSPHKPVPASSIVLAGESVGGNLALAFMQMLLTLRRLQHAATATLALPAGVATVSALTDYTLSLPSWRRNAHLDIWEESAPFLRPGFPADDIWPSTPPRADPYCSADALTHPLVSPCLAPSWAGAPLMWFAMGEERLYDSAALIAQTAAREGVRVEWLQYESMPHSWPLLLSRLPHAKHCFDEWGAACRRLCAESATFRTSAKLIGVGDLKSSDLHLDNIVDLDLRKAREIMETKAATREAYLGRRKTQKQAKI